MRILCRPFVVESTDKTAYYLFFLICVFFFNFCVVYIMIITNSAIRRLLFDISRHTQVPTYLPSYILKSFHSLHLYCGLFFGPAGKIISMTNSAHGGKLERNTVSDFYSIPTALADNWLDIKPLPCSRFACSATSDEPPPSARRKLPCPAWPDQVSLWTCQA